MKYIIIILVVIVVVNLPPIKWILGSDDCRYSNFTGSFTYEEMNRKGRSYDDGHYKFIEFKKHNAIDTTLYRNCVKHWWKIWNYADYLFQPQWKLPYANWEEIEKRRGPIENKSGFQDF